MSKKITASILAFSLLLLLSFSAFAATPEKEIEQLSNGYYIVTEIEGDSMIALRSTTTTKTKTSTCYNNSNEKVWSVSVTGTFSYGNGTATCLSASCSAKSYNSTWSVGNKTSSKSGNKAIASATGVQYYNGHEVQSIKRTVTLTCSPTGQFS